MPWNSQNRARIPVNMRTDLVQQPDRQYQSLVWGFENTISLISLRKWSFLTLVSVGGEDWSPLSTGPWFMLVTPDLRSEDISHLPKMICTCHSRRHKRRGFYPWIRKILWRRKWQLALIILTRQSHGQRNLAGYSLWGSQRVEHDWSDLAYTTGTSRTVL